MQARKTIALLFQIKQEHILFTAGAADANTLAMRIAILNARKRGIPLSGMHILIGGEEHPSVRESARYFQSLGVQFSEIPAEKTSVYTPEHVIGHIRKETVFVSLQYINSIHGRLQLITKISRHIRTHFPEVFIHTDAAQATAYYACSPTHLSVDAVTIDGSKAFGPQGTGALLLQKECGSIHSGTPPVALIAGFAVALREAHTARERNIAALVAVRNFFLKSIIPFSPEAFVHGIYKPLRDVEESDWEMCAPHLLNISFPDTNHAYLATLLDTHGFSVSTETACNDPQDEALRIGFLPTTKMADVTACARCLQSILPLAKRV